MTHCNDNKFEYTGKEYKLYTFSMYIVTNSAYQ